MGVAPAAIGFYVITALPDDDLTSHMLTIEGPCLATTIIPVSMSNHVLCMNVKMGGKLDVNLT